jgi:hypothetical protein
MDHLSACAFVRMMVSLPELENGKRYIGSKFFMVIVLEKLQDHMYDFLPGSVYKLRRDTK